MALNIGDLYVQIGANTDALKAAVPAFNRLEGAINKLTSSVDNMNSKLGKSYNQTVRGAKRSSTAFTLMATTAKTSTKIISGAFGKLSSALTFVRRQVLNLRNGFIALAAVYGVKQVVNTSATFEGLEAAMYAVTGSSKAAAKEFAFVRRQAMRLGLDIEEMSTQYTRLLAATKDSAIEGDETRKIFLALSESMRVLQISADDQAGAFRALIQMVSKGKIQAEEIRRQFGERIPGAFEMAAKAIGVTASELDDMLKRGEVRSVDLLPKLADEMIRKYGAGVPKAVTKAKAEFQRLTTEFKLLQKAIGEAGVLEFVKNLSKETRSYLGALRSITEQLEPFFNKKMEGLFDPKAPREYFNIVKQGLVGLLEGLKTVSTAMTSFSTEVLNLAKKARAQFYDLVPGQTDQKLESLKRRLQEINEQVSEQTISAKWDTSGAAPKLISAEDLSKVDPELLEAKRELEKKLKDYLGEAKAPEIDTTFFDELIVAIKETQFQFEEAGESADSFSGKLPNVEKGFADFSDESKHAFADLLKDLAVTEERAERWSDNVVKSLTKVFNSSESEINNLAESAPAILDTFSYVFNGIQSMVQETISSYQELADHHARMAQDALEFGQTQTQFYTTLADTVRYSNREQAQAFEERAVAANRAAAEEYRVQKEKQEKANQEAKKAFENNKRLRAAEIAIDTASAAIKAYLAMSAIPVVGPALGAAAAATVAALGQRQISMVKQQEYAPRQRGGSVVGGKPYLVGEAGPELIVPNSGGTVIPNNKLEQAGVGGGDTNVTFQINAVDASGFDQLLRSRRGAIINMIREATNKRMSRSPV